MLTNVIISTESTCDLSQELINQYGLKIIEMNYYINGNEFSSGDKSTNYNNLYEKMQVGYKVSTTQINQESYTNYFNTILQENKNIIHICFSSGLSGTIEVARSVAETLNEQNSKKIYVIDSLCACSGQGMLAILAKQYCQNANTIEELINYIEETKLKINHIFSVDTLKYLVNGGRVNQTQAIFTSLLNIKPLMKMDNLGKLCVTQKVISRKKSLLNIIEKVISTYNSTSTTCFISHANCEKDAIFIKEKLETNTNLKPIITNLGPIIGCHSGPGTIAVYFIGNSR